MLCVCVSVFISPFQCQCIRVCMSQPLHGRGLWAASPIDQARRVAEMLPARECRRQKVQVLQKTRASHHLDVDLVTAHGRIHAQSIFDATLTSFHNKRPRAPRSFHIGVSVNISQKIRKIAIRLRVHDMTMSACRIALRVQSQSDPHPHPQPAIHSHIPT